MDSSSLPESIDGHSVVRLLGRGGNGLVYQVEDAQGEVRALKLFRQEERTSSDEQRFKREWDYARQLMHPNVVQVYSNGTANGVPYFLMEYVAGGHLRDFQEAHRGTGLHWLEEAPLREAMVDIVTGILRGLSYIHARRIVHRDLKPENILIAGEHTARIMDFGLARNLEASVRFTSEYTVLGTVAYMSPEQVMSAEVDPRSDLYSLGVIVYEWLYGRLPYDGTDIGSILAQIVGARPQVMEDGTLPEPLARLLRHLLEKDPSARPGGADEVLARWQAVFDGSAVLEPQEASRDLFEPVFVGRETEMQRLLRHLEELQQGQCGLVFVGGEPGVGKSRLALELLHAASRLGIGAHSARCFEDVDVPFEAFLPLLRAALKQPLNGGLQQFLQEARGLLRTVLPELGREARDRQGDRAEKFRLLETITRILELMAVPRPLLLVLDDVHQADPRSLELLVFLARNLLFAPPESHAAGFRGVLVVALYRDEGQVEQLITNLSQLPGVDRLALQRLDAGASSRMVQSMLGGRPVPDMLLSRLAEESDGNAFFITEFLKALLQDNLLVMHRGAWQLESQALRWGPGMDSTGLPIPLTVRDVIRRRLQRLSPRAQEMLRLAAVLGREFRYELLRKASGRSEDEVLEAVEELIAARLLVEVPRREAVCFHHPQIREVVLEEVTAVRRRALHERAAQALEEMASSHPAPYLYDLAHHFAAARITHRAAHYLLLAADQAFDAHAYEKAIESLQQVLDLAQEGADLDEPDLLAAQVKMALCHQLCGAYRQAVQIYTAIEGRLSGLERARILRRMGRALFALGEHDRAMAAYKLALGVHGERLRRQRLPTLLRAVSQLQHLRRDDVRPAPSSDTPRLIELRQLYDEMLQLYYFATLRQRHLWGLEIMRRNVKTALALGQQREMAEAWLAAGFVLLQVSTERLPGLVRSEGLSSLEKAVSLSRTLSDPVRARILREAGWCLLTYGDLRGAEPLLVESIDISTRISDLGLVLAQVILAVARTIEGNLEAARTLAEAALRKAEVTDNATYQVFALIRLVRIALLEDRLDDAEALLGRASQAARPGWGMASMPMVRLDAMYGELLAERQQWEPALARLESARHSSGEGAVSLYDRVAVNVACGMAWLDAMAAGMAAPGGWSSVESLVRETRAMVADSYPKAMSLMLDGRLQAARGNRELARRRFERALGEVEPRALPLQTARLLVEGGLALGDTTWRVRARDLCIRHGYRRLLRRLEQTAGI
ncbi:MAG: serine/threonine-protein kinase [Candidatus Xenobia bacterium]